MSTTRNQQREEEVYENQNDQRLDELHSKIRTLRGVTTDIYDDVERQNLTLDETSNSFTTFGQNLSSASQRALRAFGIGGTGSIRQTRIIVYVVGGMFLLWVIWKVFSWWFGGAAGSDGSMP